MKNTDANKIAVYWNFAAFLPKIRLLPKETAKAIAQEASDACGENPLHLIATPDFSIPSYATPKMTGPQVIAIMLACLWVLCGEDEEIAGAMLSDWPDIPAFAMLSKAE